MKKTLIFSTTLLFLPVVAFAQSNVEGFVDTIVGIINNALVPLVFALAFIFFIFGVFKFFITGASDEESRENGRNLMIYGLIGFFVIATVWGLVNVLVGTFDLESRKNFDFPTAEEAR